MKNQTLSMLVSAKMNMHLIDGLGDSVTECPMFESVLEFIDSVVEQEEVAMIGAGSVGVNAVSDGDMDVDDSASGGSGDTDD